MTFLAAPGWQITCSVPQPLVTALFARDVLGLEVSVRPALPPVEPVVTPRAPLSGPPARTAADEWDTWWSRTLRYALETGRRRIPPEPESVLAAALNPYRADARDWSEQRKHEIATLLNGRCVASAERGAVRAARRSLGQRRLRGLDLRVLVLPVGGDNAWRVSANGFIVSQRLRSDDAAFQDWLTRMIGDLVEAG